MIIDERMIAFVQSLDKGNTQFLTELEEEAIRTDVPIIRPAMQSLMRFLLKLHRPARILEVGTAIGFSAILMAEYGPRDCHITTIEKYEKRIPLAKANFEASGYADKITLLETPIVIIGVYFVLNAAGV